MSGAPGEERPAPRSRGQQRWLALSIGTLTLALTLHLIHRFAGGAIARAAFEGGPRSLLGTFLQVGPNEALRGIEWRSTVVFRLLQVLLVLAWSIGSACFLLRRAGLPRALVALSALAVWLAFETAVAPRFQSELNLGQWFFVRDVDHHPPANDPGKGTNADGLRMRSPSSAFRADETNVLFLGDSFTWGSRVAPEEAFPAIAGERLDALLDGASVRVANFGWVSSSPLLGKRRLQAIGERYAPDVVVTCVDMTDFLDDIKYGRMLERRGIYSLYDRVPFALMLLKTFARPLFDALHDAGTGDMPRERFFHSVQPLAASRGAMEVLWSNLQAIDDWCAARGILHVAVLMPRHYQYSDRECPRNWEGEHYPVLGPHVHEPFAWWEEKRAQGGPFPLLSLLEAFRGTEVFPTCFEDDPHWTAAGHRVAGEALAELLAPLVRTGAPR